MRARPVIPPATTRVSHGSRSHTVKQTPARAVRSKRENILVIFGRRVGIPIPHWNHVEILSRERAWTSVARAVGTKADTARKPTGADARILIPRSTHARELLLCLPTAMRRGLAEVFKQIIRKIRCWDQWAGLMGSLVRNLQG